MSKKDEYGFSFNEAKKKESRHDWTEAADDYKKTLTTQDLNDFSELSEIHERIGFCYSRAAMQAENPHEFRNHMTSAIDEYGEAVDLLNKLGDPKNPAKICHCRATESYLGSWLKPDCDSRKKSLDDCLRLEKEALRLHAQQGDSLGSGKTYSRLSALMVDLLDLEWNIDSRDNMLKDALTYGEKAISILSKLGEEHELARSYCTTSIHCHTSALGSKGQNKKISAQKTLDLSKRAVELSQKIHDQYLLGMSNIWLGSAIVDFTDREDVGINHFITALECGRDTRDNYLIGRASYLMAHAKSWEMFAEQDPKKKLKLSKECRKYSQEAIRRFSLIFNYGEVASSYYCLAETYSVLATSTETDVEKKRALLKKSIVTGKKGLKYARQSGSISALWFILHPLSKSLYYLSTLEPNLNMKKQLLEKSLQYRKENIKTLATAMPNYFWNHGVYCHYLALIQADLAGLESSKQQKARLLDEAVKSGEDCVNLCLLSETLGHEQLVALGKYHEDLGNILERFYLKTGDRNLQHKTLEAYKGALKAYEQAHMPNCIAESHWKLANIHNKLRDFQESAKNFELAHENYTVAAENIPALRDFYTDHADYMKGWSEIERARYYHGSQDYTEAKKHYEQAAASFTSTRSRKYLVPNVLAWAQLEHGEKLSGNEESKKAAEAFKQAIALFGQAKTSTEAVILEGDDDDQKQEALWFSESIESRLAYCQGRILLEEARIDDAQGNARQSAEKYGMASTTLEKVANELEDEPERKGLWSTIFFCQAWKEMKLAEQKLKPSLYREASKLFAKAKEFSSNEKLSLLFTGNATLCDALAMGAKFEATGDLTVYSSTKQKMESAANYYLKAGFAKAAIWVNANQALVDAYVYMNRAETETSPEAKIPNYRLAERCLERSAELCRKAGYMGKADQVLKVLASLRDKQKFVLSLGAVLSPPTLSDTKALQFPSSFQEEAVGIERFEHVNIHASVSTLSEVTVGDVFGLHVDIANVAKENGMLVRIDDLIPPPLTIVKIAQPYSVEGYSLNAGGRQLVPHKVESIEISVQASKTGSFQLCPTVVYVDELGNFKKFKCETIQMSVLPPASFQFKTANSQKVFEYLVKEFTNDYMKRRLPLERSGWRTLVQIQTNARVPKSSLYGTSVRKGYAISELERRGVVETRIFEGERGRGGKITKTRIYYEKDIIKRFIDVHVMKIQEK